MSRKQSDTNGPASGRQGGTGAPAAGEETGAAGTGPQNGSQGAGTQDRDGAGGSGTGQDANGTGQGTGQEANGTGTGPGDDQGGGEAARFRRRLRETEVERDRLAGQVADLQRREVERLAADVLAVGADLLALDGATLPDLLDDDGHVVADRVTTAAAELVRSRPGLAAAGYHRPFAGAGMDIGGGSRLGTRSRGGDGWGSALRGER